MKSTGKVMLGLVALFAAGALAGMLFAPDKGERTRRKIARKSKDVFDTINDTIDDSKDTLEDMRGQLKHNLEKVTNKIEHIAHKN